MATFEIADLPKPYALALDWHTLSGTTSQAKEVAKLCKEEGVRLGVILVDEVSGTTVVGLSADGKVGVSCGAACLAAAAKHEPTILIEPLGEGRVWMCAVRAGLPVPGLDIVVDLSQLDERMREFLHDGTESRICSTLPDLDRSYQHVTPVSFAELVASASRDVKVRRISGVSPALVGAVAAVVLAGGGWYAFDGHMQRVKQLDSQAKLAKIAEDQKRTAAQQAEQARLAHIQDGENLLRNVVLTKPPVDALVKAYFDRLQGLPLSAGNWKMKSFECDPAGCRVLWTRTPSGTVLSFVRAVEEHGWTLGSVRGNDAMTSFAVDVAGRDAPVDSLSEDKPFRAALETKLQDASAAGVSYELSDSTSIEASLPPPAAATATGGPPGKAAAPAAPAASEALPWKVGTLNVTGTSLFVLRELPATITNAGIALSGLRADLKNNDWSLDFNYATR